jgi:hypothetical protein
VHPNRKFVFFILLQSSNFLYIAFWRSAIVTVKLQRFH